MATCVSWRGLSLLGVLAVCISCLPGCGNTTTVKGVYDLSPTQHRSRIEGSTYIDESFNCKVTSPNPNWTLVPNYGPSGDALNLVQINRSSHNAIIQLAISRHEQPTLEAFAGVGTYNSPDARFTYVAGMRCFYISKPMSAQGFTFTSAGYKFVADRKGYLLMVLYPQQFTHDSALNREIDEVLNSFDFLKRPASVGETAVPATPRSGKLSRVAVLDLIDTSSNAPTEATRTLTNSLQEACASSGRFELIERRNLEKILTEKDIKLSTLVSGGQAVQTGKLIGAAYLISGSYGVLGESCVIYVQLTDVETGAILATASIRGRNLSPDKLLDLMPTLVAKLSSKL